MKNTDKIINGTIAALLIAGTVNPVYASEIIIEEDVVVVIEEDVIVEDVITEDVITEDTTNKEENIEVEMDPVEEVVPEPVPEVEIEVGEAWTPNKPNTTRPVQNVVVESDPVGETIIIEEDLIVEIDPVEDTVIYEEGEDLIVEADTAEPEIFEEVITEPVPEVEIEVGEAWTPNKPNATRPAQNVVEADPVEETVVVEEELTVEADVAVKKTPEEKRQEMQEVVRKTNNNILSVLNKLKIKR